jgi:hypothetical protein
MEASYYEGNTEVQRKTMAYLLERGAKVDVVSASHNTALYIALRAADLEIVELLLSWGADIHQKCGPDHAPVIVEIAALGFVNKFKFLLAHGADLDDIQTMTLLKTESDPKIKPLIAKWEQEKLDSVTCMISSSGDGQAIYRL